MKKLFTAFLISIAVCFVFSGCKNPSGQTPPNGDEGSNPTEILPEQSTDNDTVEEEISEMYVTINGNKLKVTLAENSSVDALVELLKQGDITYTADDYGDFEKVGYIGHTLPRNDTRITTKAGDVILYQGSNICLYYGTNDWSFTRIGKISGYSESELRSLLGAGEGSMQVTLSLK